MKVRSLLLSLALGLLASASSHAQTVWVGTTDGLFTTLSNWSAGTPANSNLIFGANPIRSIITVDAPMSVSSLTFSGIYPPYTFNASNSAILTIGSGGINVAAQPASPVDFTVLPVELSASQTWTIDGVLRSTGTISSAAGATTALTKTGTGTLTLGGNNTFNGGVVVDQGTLFITAGSIIGAGGTITSGSLGIGGLTLGANSTFGATRPGLLLANPISISSGATLVSGGSNERDLGLTLTGPVTAATAEMSVFLSGGSPLVLAGSIDGPVNTAYRFQSKSTNLLDGAVLAGTTSANVSTLVADRAALYFVSSESLPETVTVQAINGGYVSVASAAASVGLPPMMANLLISRIADPAAFAGTFGFDTQAGAGAPHVYDEDLDFSTFTHPSFRIGSATEAILTGVITPPTNDSAPAYRFGSGGGHLFVQSNLADVLDSNSNAIRPTAVEISSRPNEDLSGIILEGQNTFSGTITVGTVTSNLRVARAMAVLNSPGALPAAATYSLGDLAYLGYTEAVGFTTFADFLSRVAPNGYDANSVFGLDSHVFVEEKRMKGDSVESGAVRVYTGLVDLSALNGGYLGTITRVRIEGEVRAPSTGLLQLTGVSEGRLAITSNLSATTADALPNIDRVVIGHPGTGADEFTESEVELTGASTYLGGTTLQSGTLLISNNSTLAAGVLVSGPIGLGTLTVMFASDPVVLASNSASGATLYNDITLFDQLQLGRTYFFTAQNASAPLDPNPLTLAGDISGVGGIDLYGRAVLSGANTYAGGTHAHSGNLIFANVSAIPADGTLKSDVAGYIGLNSAPSSPQSLQTDYINRFDPTSAHGTIGFDTDPNSTAPTVFSDSISLANLTSTTARLGSSTVAKLTGTITPAGTIYRFGGGGGYLEVASSLIGTTSEVDVSSPHGASLTLRLTGTNGYAGRTNASNSAIIFGAGALPTASPFSMDPNGYIGSEDPSLDTNFSPFLGRFASNLSHGTIGFDTNPASSEGRVINSTLDLRYFTASTPNFHIGTSTHLTFSAASSIILPTSATAYRFTAYKGGRLQIDTVLSGSVGMVIGDPHSLMSQVSPSGVNSRVVLNAENTFSGGTTLYAGEIYLGTSTATEGAILSGPFGTGTLTVQPMQVSNRDLRPSLRALSAPVTLANAIALNSDLGVASDITLTGSIAGPGGIYKTDAGTLTLSGINSSWVGGIFISEGNVTFERNSSAGTGMLKLGGSVASTATFLSAAPNIGSLAGDNASNQVLLAANSVLNISQNGTSQFMGEISGAGASVRIQGFNPNVANQLTLGGANTYTAGTTIGPNATIIAAHNNALGTTGGVTLNQGSLSVAQGVTATFSANTHRLIVNGGKLGGNGTFALDSSLTVNGGSNGQVVALAPGFSQPGKLTFNFTQGATLILGSGGEYQWKLVDANNANGGWDTIEVNGPIDITATSLARFDLTIASVNADGTRNGAADFDVFSSYSWTLLTSTSTITGFDANVFNIDTSMFANRTFDGTFSLGLDANGTSLMLNYTAASIPEPSTWAMLIIGVAVIAFSTFRRRR